MKNINIIIVNDYGHINGGASSVALNSAIELKKRGYNVIVFSAVEPIMDELIKNKIEVISTKQFDILNNPNRLSSIKQGIWNKVAYNSFVELLNRFDTNNTIIHIHSWTKALSSSVVRAALDRKIKVVITLHDYFTACPNGGLYNYKNKRICKLTPLSRRCIFCNCDSRYYYHKLWRILRQVIQIHKGLIPKDIKNYIYISETSKKILEERLPSDSNYYFVKNPIDVEKKNPVDVKNNASFIYVGRFSKEKGVLLFAEAARKLNCDAVFIGDGELKEKIKEIYPKAILTGWLNKNGMEEYLNKARVLVFPSLWYETLGMTALEVKSKGIPVIVSDQCVTREIINNEISGLWFKGNNINDLQRKMQIIKDDDKLVEKLGKSAFFEYWNNPYDLNSHINMLIKSYDKIINLED